MMRTFKYPLRPTRDQAATLTRWLEVCADLHNAALQERREAWRVARRPIRYLHQQSELVAVRQVDQDVALVPSEISRSVLRRVDLAFKAFFRRCRAGQKPGYPRFRSRRRYESMTFPFVSLTGNRVHVIRLGSVRFHRYRPIEGEPRTVTVRRERTGKWSLSIACEMGDAPAKTPVRTAVGVDLGLTVFATLSDATEIENPRWLRTGEARLRRQQQAMFRRRRGSRSRERARIAVARAHAHVANQRLDFARKLACDLFRRYDLVAHEDLKVEQMSRGHFAKSIRDAGWAIFLHALHCKAEKAGKHAVAVDPRGTTQRCSGCGSTVPKGIGDRVHACSCGVILGRDHNAALNILGLGGSPAEAEKSSAVETKGDRAATEGRS